MKKIRKVVIPAAGLGTRFLPATKSQAKEMLPIVDKPCIQYLVEEAVASGIEEIIIITGRGKRSIEDHFDHSFELACHLKDKNDQKALKEIEKLEKLAKIAYVRQPYPMGDGHAILCAKELIGDEPFAVLFGDDIYDSETPALAQLLKIYEEVQTPVIGLHKIDKKDSDKYGIIKGKKVKNGLYSIEDMVEKPKPDKAPSNMAIIGKYIITPELLKTLTKSKVNKNKELRLVNGMMDFLKIGEIYGYELEGQRFDTGDKLGYLKAITHFALKHDELKTDFKKYLKDILK
jgi:UTP--glucose-1-phosphate uridylyltransferase